MNPILKLGFVFSSYDGLTGNFVDDRQCLCGDSLNEYDFDDKRTIKINILDEYYEICPSCVEKCKRICKYCDKPFEHYTNTDTCVNCILFYYFSRFHKYMIVLNKNLISKSISSKHLKMQNHNYNIITLNGHICRCGKNFKDTTYGIIKYIKNDNYINLCIGCFNIYGKYCKKCKNIFHDDKTHICVE